MFDAVRVKNDLVQWMRDWFAVNGPDCNCIVGVSGGKDSSVVAALAVEALGKDRVIGVKMPKGYQWDISESNKLINHLGIRGYEINILHAYNSLINEMKVNGISEISDQTTTNLPARLRMSVLYAVSQSHNGRVSCNSNLSERYIGYCTVGGDSIGDFSPLANLTSDEVIAVGDALGLPYELTHKTPSDGLCGKSDEDNFGFTYAVLNKYIRTGVCEDAEIKAKIDSMHTKNAFKFKPIPKFEYEPRNYE